MITIYHNSRCSKSREALTLVEQFAARNAMEVNVVEYLKTPPSSTQLLELHRQVGGELREMVRTNEDEYEGLGLAEVDDAALLDAIHAHPKLLQRPIVVYAGRAIVARPPELLRDFLSVTK